MSAASASAGACPNGCLRHIASSCRRGAALIALFSAIATPASSAMIPETFGLGKVACERLGANQFDCLLTALRISGSDTDVATFGLDTLPEAERAIFQAWCTLAADDCTVQLQGTRMVPGSSRLSDVTSVQWTRLMPPRDQAAARASGH